MIATNVLLDYLLERQPFFEDAKNVILSCTEGNTNGCIAAHSISNMFFILRKDYTAKERREILLNLCTIFEVEGGDKAKLLSGLTNDEFSDFEDCLQMECAKSYGAEYMVTRNMSDYSVGALLDFLIRLLVVRIIFNSCLIIQLSQIRNKYYLS